MNNKIFCLINVINGKETSTTLLQLQLSVIHAATSGQGPGVTS